MRSLFVGMVMAMISASTASAQSCMLSANVQSQISSLNYELENLASQTFSESAVQNPIATMVIFGSGFSAVAWAHSLVEEDEMEPYQWALAIAALMGGAWCDETEVNSRACTNVIGRFTSAGVRAARIQGEIQNLRNSPRC